MAEEKKKVAEKDRMKVFYNPEMDDIPFPEADRIGEFEGIEIQNIIESGGNKIVSVAVFGSDESVATGDGTIAISIPFELNGFKLVRATGVVHTQGVTGYTEIQIRRRRGGSDADMLTTLITIGEEYYNTSTGIEISSSGVQEGDQIYVDVDSVHSGTAPKGLSVVLTFSNS
jgi:hypothetical protein